MRGPALRWGMPDDAPYVSDFSLIVHFDPMMVAELAMGADHPHEIAERYGVDPVDYEHLAAQEWFGKLVAQKRVEFHETGVLFTAKAGMMAEALLTRLFQQSMASVLPPPLMVEVAKQLTDIGRLKPQPINTTPGTGGGAFQINIVIPGQEAVAGRDAPHDITPRPQAASDALQPPSPGASVKGVDTPAVTDTPAGVSMSLPFRVPDFDMRPAGQPPTSLGLPAPLPTSPPVSATGANASAFGGALPPPTKAG